MDWEADRSLPDDYITKPSEKIMDMMEEENVCEELLALWHCSRLCATYCALGDKQSTAQWARKGAALAATFRKDIGPWKEVVKAPEKSPLWRLRL